MKLLHQILSEAGADLDYSFTIAPKFGGYFKGVKRVHEYSHEKVVLEVNKKRIAVTGNELVIDKYFQQDLIIKGDISGVNFE